MYHAARDLSDELLYAELAAPAGDDTLGDFTVQRMFTALGLLLQVPHKSWRGVRTWLTAQARHYTLRGALLASETVTVVAASTIAKMCGVMASWQLGT